MSKNQQPIPSSEKVVQFRKVPDKNLKSLTEEELQLAYQTMLSLMRVGIPTAVYFDATGVMYDGTDNVVERKITLAWLTCKGIAVLTSVRSNEEFTIDRVQVLANGIAQQYQEDMKGQAV